MSASKTDEGVRTLATLAQHEGLSVAVAESLTCGALASALGRGENASTWLAGGVVAYLSEVKFRVLGVTEGPVVTASCARQMAQGVQRLLGADLAIAVTGVGGPDPEEGKPPGTVFVATALGDRVRVEERAFSGEPEDVLDRTIAAAVEQALQELVETPRR